MQAFGNDIALYRLYPVKMLGDITGFITLYMTDVMPYNVIRIRLSLQCCNLFNGFL